MELTVKSINWFGLVTGVLMLALPFMGFWWIGTAGTGAMEIGLSPFDFSASFLGQPLSSSLIGLFLLAAKITIIIAGSLMIVGSIFAKTWWGKHLVRFGVFRPLWMIILLITMLVIGALIFNNVLPGMLSGMTGGAGGAVQTNINIPYISGSATSTIQIGPNAAITAPVTLSLTATFFVAVAVAALGIVTRIYQGRLTKPKKLMVRPKLLTLRAAEPKKVIKVKPAGEKKIIVRPAEAKKVIKVKSAKKKKIIKVRPK